MKKQKNTTHRSVPATVGLVKEVREELKAGIRDLSSEMRAVEHRLRSKIETVESKVETFESKIEKVLVSVHHTQVLMEEQRGENKIVLDGIKTLIERQDRIESEVGGLRNTIRTLAAARQ